MDFYVLLLVVVQPRSWVILRHLVYLWKKPVQLSTGDDEDSPLLRLSQMQAVKTEQRPPPHGAALEFWQSMRSVGKLLSIENYLALITEDWDNRRNTILKHYRKNGEIFKNSTTLWRDEVISWYLKTIWYAKARIRAVVAAEDSAEYFYARSERDGDDMLLESELDQFSWCSRVLLEHKDFSNISVFGFVASLAVMISIYIASYLRGWKKFLQTHVSTKAPSRAMNSRPEDAQSSQDMGAGGYSDDNRYHFRMPNSRAPASA
ncbi:hypothetical protein TWF730_004236 [Orbilia blumenaviensis]|uniref:Uncharacterized protein n=1 Tax=Orbilia blumenaviensis TaxID=1796055 RepID=A0AAV9U1C1_9PEZI